MMKVALPQIQPFWIQPCLFKNQHVRMQNARGAESRESRSRLKKEWWLCYVLRSIDYHLYGHKKAATAHNQQQLILLVSSAVLFYQTLKTSSHDREGSGKCHIATTL